MRRREGATSVPATSERMPEVANAASAGSAPGAAFAQDADLGLRQAPRLIVAPLQMRAAPESLAMPRNDAIVVGVVRDDHTGEPVAGASILLDNGDIGTLTDHVGRFAIVGTTTGVHRAQVRRTGYAPADREVAVAGDSSVLDVRLTPSSASIAAALGPGYTAATSDASGKSASGGAAPSERRRSTKQVTPTSSAPAASSAATESADSLAADVAAAAKSTREALARSDVALSTRAAVPSRRRTQGYAAGSCVSIVLETMAGVPSDGAARTVMVRLLPTVSRDTSVDGTFAIEFLRSGDVAEQARGAWVVVPRANQDERNASDVQLHWIAGDEVVRMRLDWTKESPSGIASVRRGNVGVDAKAIATRVECRSVK